MKWSLLSATLLTLALHATARPHSDHSQPRGIIYEGSPKEAYDFVIVGGGLAGLVLASRLSEDSNRTVLVLEAGQTGDDVADQVNHPGNTYWNSLGSTSYNWNFQTSVQSGLNNRATSWPRGKILGGSSATNGMYLVRPNQAEINAWHDLIASDNEDAAKHWTSDAFFATMRESETFGAPSSDVQALAGIKYTESSHGSSGPVHYSYPGISFGLVGNWTQTWETLGVPATDDAYNGNNLGSFIANSAINPSNWTRSYSRAAYIEPLPPRDNLDILAGATVTKINWDTSNGSNITATSVEYASAAGQSSSTVKVNKEVILSGGTVGSAHVLLLSGVGPKDVIESVGLSVVNELPGVGQNVQDHLVAGVMYNTKEMTAGTEQASGSDYVKTDLFLSYINSATAYINATRLFGSDAAGSLKQSMDSEKDNSASTLIPSKDQTVLDGYKAVYEATTGLFSSDVGQVEILQSITAPGSVIIQAAIQHPLSHGHIYLNSSDPFTPPIIDPGYLSHSADVQIMREGMKLARTVAQTEPLSQYLTQETQPGSDVQTDEQWETWVRNNVATEYHPTASCSMLPKDKGGVVNANLQVYGTANVRVIDASIIPIHLSTHLGAPTYAIAETGASIIHSLYNGKGNGSSSNNSNGSGNGSDNSQPDNGSNNDDNGALSTLSSPISFRLLVAAVLGLLVL